MEAATLIAKPFLARAKSAEILSSLWHNVTVELENDSRRWACAGQVIRAELIQLRDQGSEVALPSFTVRSK